MGGIVREKEGEGERGAPCLGCVRDNKIEGERSKEGNCYWNN